MHFIKRTNEPLFVSYIAQEQADLGTVKQRITLLHVPLLPLVAAEDDHLCRRAVFQKMCCHGSTKTTCTTGDEDIFVAEYILWVARHKDISPKIDLFRNLNDTRKRE